MRTVQLRGLEPTVLGFGCGAVLGRTSRKDSMRALAEAWEQGINFYDTARSYGYGEAEGVLGEFLQGRRHQAVISTKFGIVPPKKSALKNAVKPLVRGLLQVLPSARTMVRRAAHVDVAAGQFTVATLNASLEESLRQLRTDYVDLLFLHSAPASALQQADLLDALDRAVSAGKVRVAGISAEVDVLRQAMDMPVFGSFQTAANLFDMGVTQLSQADRGNHLYVANHPFGGVSRVQESKATIAALAADPAVDATLREKLHAGDSNSTLAQVVFGSVLSNTGIHTVVPAMMRLENLRTNVQAIANNRFTTDELAFLRTRFQQGASAPPVA